MISSKKIFKVQIAYIFIFYSIWAFYVLIIRDYIDILISNKCTSQFIKGGLIKNTVWTLPAILLIKHFKDYMYIKAKEMFVNKVNWLRYLPIFIAFTIYLLLRAYVKNGKIAISNDFDSEKIVIFLFVGLTEEIVFRGWLLNGTIKEKRQYLPIITNSVLFLIIHFPIWLQEGAFINNFLNGGFICIILLSMIFSWTFIKSKNILVPITLHMYWDLLMFLFH